MQDKSNQETIQFNSVSKEIIDNISRYFISDLYLPRSISDETERYFKFFPLLAAGRVDHDESKGFTCHDVGADICTSSSTDTRYFLVIPADHVVRSLDLSVKIIVNMSHLCNIVEKANGYPKNTLFNTASPVEYREGEYGIVFSITPFMKKSRTQAYIVFKLLRIAGTLDNRNSINTVTDIVEEGKSNGNYDSYAYYNNPEAIVFGFENIDFIYENSVRNSFLSARDKLAGLMTSTITKQQQEQKRMEKIKQRQAELDATYKYQKGQHRIQVLSRHPSHEPLREELYTTHRIVIALGSTSPTPEVKNPKLRAKGCKYLRINSVEAVTNSASKFRMKQCFRDHNVKTADYAIPANAEELDNWLAQFDDNVHFVTKSEFGSRAEGLNKHSSKQELRDFMRTRYGRRIVERFYNYNREYRLHVDAQGCFYTCRKMLRSNAPEDTRWYRNDSNSNWIVEENELFDKPVNWKAIEQECVKALNAVGLDVGACDVRVQSNKDAKGRTRENPDFIICEINSAPSFGQLTLEKYQNRIPIIAAYKLDQLINQ